MVDIKDFCDPEKIKEEIKESFEKGFHLQYKNIKSFRNKRNTIIHSFILKNEKLKDIDLKKYKELGENCLEMLIKEWVRKLQIQKMSEKIITDILSEIKELRDENQ